LEFVSVAITLFLVMDPMGNIPVFLSVLDRLPPERRRAVLVRELLLALGVIVVFALLGRQIMGLLGLRQESVSIGGGIILFLIALRMVFPRQAHANGEELEGEPFLVPLAVPLVAGPSLLAVLMLFATKAAGGLPALLAAAGLAWAASFALLYGSTFLLRLLGRRGLVAMERLMGMVLVTLAVQLFLDGLATTLGG
jgi:multiple antibiotic resistance protein